MSFFKRGADMALREIRTQGDPVLSKECKPVKEMTPRVEQLIDDMFETMYENEGAGLAAPQVGILKQIVVIDVGDGNQYVLINPRIVEQSGEETDFEGCLSVPGLRGKVTRAEKVTVEALNENFEQVAIAAEGLLARCIQHEVDHLHGKLYTELVEGDLMSIEQMLEEESEEAED